MSRHLDPDLVQDLLTGRLDQEEEASLFRHLQDGDCAACEAGLEALDSATEQALFTAIARAERMTPAGSGAKEAVLDRALRRPWFSRPLVWAPAAAAAAMLILALVWFAPFGRDGGLPDAGQRIKGDPQAGAEADLELSLGLAGRAADGSTSVRRLPRDPVVTTEGRVVFSITTSGECWLYLARLGPGGQELLLPEDLGAQVRSSPGKHTPTRDESPLGVDLSGLRGEQRFVALCSQTRLTSSEQVLSLARTAASVREKAPTKGLSLSQARLTVEPGGARP